MKHIFLPKVKLSLLSFGVALLLTSCSKTNSVKQNQPKSLDDLIEASATKKLAPDATPGVEKTTTCEFKFSTQYEGGCGGSAFGSQPRLISSVPFFGTHGQIEVGEVQGGYGGIVMSARYVAATGLKYGDGFAVKYPFKKGVTYKIIVNGGGTYEHPPLLNAQLTNQIPTTNCNDAQAVYFDQMGLPWQQFPAFPGASAPQYNRTYVTKQIQFAPDGCYDYLWIATVPSFTDDNKNDLLLNSLQIVEVSHLEVTGDANFCTGTTKTFQATYDGNLLAGPFTWTVTGNLAIIGSNVGNTIQVQSTSTHGVGTVSYTAGANCLSIVSRDIVVGAPTPQFLLTQLDPTLGRIRASVRPVANATSYNWYFNDALISSAHGESVTVDVKRNACGMTYDLKVEAITSNCGLSLKNGVRLSSPPCQ